MATKLHDSLLKQRKQVQTGFNKLSDELKTWCQNNGLPFNCALELLMSDLPNDIQRDYLREFVDRWEMLERLDSRIYLNLQAIGDQQ